MCANVFPRQKQLTFRFSLNLIRFKLFLFYLVINGKVKYYKRWCIVYTICLINREVKYHKRWCIVYTLCLINREVKYSKRWCIVCTLCLINREITYHKRWCIVCTFFTDFVLFCIFCSKEISIFHCR
jgi:hypothetical protein